MQAFQKNNKANMDSDESSFSGEEGALFEDNFQPYRFEPTYTEAELQIMTAHSCSSSSPIDMSWCKCGNCVSNINIDEKICCKNPLLLSDEEFEHHNCIAQTTDSLC